MGDDIEVTFVSDVDDWMMSNPSYWFDVYVNGCVYKGEKFEKGTYTINLILNHIWKRRIPEEKQFYLAMLVMNRI